MTCAFCAQPACPGLAVIAACDDHWETAETAARQLRDIVDLALAYRDACATETQAGWLKEVEGRQVALFEALEAFQPAPEPAP
jgi:hypothetical protein